MEHNEEITLEQNSFSYSSGSWESAISESADHHAIVTSGRADLES